MGFKQLPGSDTVISVYMNCVLSSHPSLSLRMLDQVTDQPQEHISDEQYLRNLDEGHGRAE